MESIKTVEAAAQLGVSDRQVRYLIERGELVSPERGLVSVDSVTAYLARHGDVKTRVWAPRTAWAAIELMTGGTAEWLGSSQRSRLKRALMSLDVESVVSRLRNRADVRIYRFEPAALEDIASRIVVVRDGDGALDGYVNETELQQLIADHGMVRRGTGNLVARVLADDIGQDFVEVVASQGSVLAGIDLAGSTERSERILGLRLTSEALSSIE